MIYGLIFSNNIQASAKTQRAGIEKFAQKRGFHIDQFVSYEDSPNITLFQSDDIIICYAWSCLGNTMVFIRTFIRYILRKKIHTFSATSKYCIDNTYSFDQFEYAFDLYEDIRSCFLSKKSADGAKKRIENGYSPGRQIGSKNTRHVLDGKEKTVWDMFARGASMYAIAKAVHVSAPTIKRFLSNQN